MFYPNIWVNQLQIESIVSKKPIAQAAAPVHITDLFPPHCISPTEISLKTWKSKNYVKTGLFVEIKNFMQQDGRTRTNRLTSGAKELFAKCIVDPVNAGRDAPASSWVHYGQCRA